LDADSDDDGLLDGQDVEFIQNIINDLPASAFKKGKSLQDHKTAMKNMLNDVEGFLLEGQDGDAIRLLENLRSHVDGEPNADKTDWIIDNAARMRVRDLIDMLINNLSV
jgi:sensor domain CHASE-containing protein